MRAIQYYAVELDEDWHLPLVDLEIIDGLYGNLQAGDTITLYGQDGLNCAMSIGGDDLVLEDEFIVFSFGINQDGEYRTVDFSPISNYPLGEFPSCGISYLEISYNTIQGDIIPYIGNTSLQDFINNLPNCLGISSTYDVLADEEWTIYPNPATDRVVMDLDPMAVDLIEIRDINGRQVWSDRTSAGRHLNTLNGLDRLAPGIYFLTVYTEQGAGTKRLVIQ